MDDDKKVVFYYVLVVLALFIITGVFNSRGDTPPKYTGYCNIEGSYRRRYVVCYGDYSPDARRAAEAKANQCNRTSDPVQGCTGSYR